MRYEQQLARLRERKVEQTKAKLLVLGAQDEDDYGNVLPPAGDDWTPPTECWFGAKAWGRVFRSVMEHHPVYLDPDDALAGRWMYLLSRLRPQASSRVPFPFDYSHLEPDQRRYDIIHGIGGDAHFAPDYRIGLELGWGGLARKVESFRDLHRDDPEAVELLSAELEAIVGVQDWISRTADAAEGLADAARDGWQRDNLRAVAATNRRLVTEPPATLREACQWIGWFNMASRIYNRDGAGGQLDELLRPYYERDLAAGRIDDEDAVFYIACLLLNDPHYYQVGGPDRNGHDQTSRVSFLVLDAADLLRVSCNITIRVHSGMDERLFRRGMEILFAHQLGFPRFSGDQALVSGFVANGYSSELARERIAVGCNWMSLPGREYTMNDMAKVNLAKVFEVAFFELAVEPKRSTEQLFDRFADHLRRAVSCVVAGIQFHLDHQWENEPELLLNLLSHGPIEKGRDASHGGADFYNIAIDGAGLATVADSLAALEHRVEQLGQLDWDQVAAAMRDDFGGSEGERIRLLLSRSPRFGAGRSLGDRWAKRITALWTDIVTTAPAREGLTIIPGWFSWANTLQFGRHVGATANGRHAGAPISHGANPHPGFRRDGALTSIVKAVADVQPGRGNTAPLQLEVDPCASRAPNAAAVVGDLVKAHFELGGTLVNINIVDAEKILDAHQHPDRYPDLIVRVTGFTAYFANLSPEFRQLVVDRIIREPVAA